MIKDGLLVAPDFTNINKYLESGTRTGITDTIIKKSKMLKGITDGITVRNILVWMNTNTARLNDGTDFRKFKRNATEILQSNERTGCCDSSTLFTAFSRSLGIPTMQIITLSKRWAKNINEGKKVGTTGHFLAGVYLKDINGKSCWSIVDTDRYVTDVRDVIFMPLKVESRNIRDLYSFAYVKDYYDDLGIDSIEKMAEVQINALKKCVVIDFEDKNEIGGR